jgi:Fe-S cluster biogenesis protein NfuA
VTPAATAAAAAAPPLAGPEEATFETRAARIARAQRAVDVLDPVAREAATELLTAVEEHQRAVLKALTTALRASEAGREILFAVVDDPEVYAALVKAGIARPSLAMRAVQVLEGIRPYLAAHGGDVELSRIDDGIVYVRLLGACQSCGSATETLRDQVANALLEHLPEVREVREEQASAPAPAFIPLSSLTVGRSAV